MTADRRPQDVAPGLRRVEPVILTVLAAHGSAVVLLEGHPRALLLVFGAGLLAGLAGLAGWSSETAVVTRGAVCLATALGVQVAEPATVPGMLHWYYALAAVYGLVLRDRLAVAVGPLAGAAYLAQVALGAGVVPWSVALLRAAVLAALGLVAFRAGAAYRAAAREAEEVRLHLEHRAGHDQLTGLPNRTLLQSTLQALVQPDGGRAPGAALLLLDLDRFQDVNDSLGHHYGDALLAQVAGRLREAAPPEAVVSRLGGDEFAVLVPGAEAADAVILAEALRLGLVEPFALDDVLVATDASVGVVLAPEHGADSGLLLRRADVAMYVAKRAGSGVAIYDPAEDASSQEALALLADLRRGVDAGQLVVHYQPQLDLQLDRVTGVEALVRWQHPVRGLLAPDVFIPLAERSGVIETITDRVLDTALEQCRRWADEGRCLSVSVNISARSLARLDLPCRVRAALERWQVPAERLELEITESFLLADPARARALLLEIHRMGVRLAVDDFGTGLSSLAYLKQLPVDTLKIDKSFVRHLVADRADQVIVQGVVDLAAGLGLRTVAEGVEDDGALALLRRTGCTAAQGYALGRPMDVGVLQDWLAAHDARSRSA